MKKLLLISFLLCFSCNGNLAHEKLCVEKVNYIDQRKNLVPSVIEISISDTEKKLEVNKLTNVFLYSIAIEDRIHFSFYNEVKIKGKPTVKDNLLVLKMLTSYFDNRNNLLSKKEIDSILKTDVGLVFGKDTIRIKYCE